MSRRPILAIWTLAEFCFLLVFSSSPPPMVKFHGNPKFAAAPIKRQLISKINNFIKQPSNKISPIHSREASSENSISSNRYPYLCFLVAVDSSNNPISSCGGALLHDDIVLSSAQCGLDDNSQPLVNMLVLAGNLRLPLKSSLVQFSFVETFWFSKENFDTSNHDDGILIMKLRTPFVGIPSVHLNANALIPVINQTTSLIGIVGSTKRNSSKLPSTSTHPESLITKTTMTIQTINHCSSHSSHFVEKIVLLCANQLQESDGWSVHNGGQLILPRASNALSDVLVGIGLFRHKFLSFNGKSQPIDDNGLMFARVSHWHDVIVSLICAESSTNVTYLPCSSRKNTSQTRRRQQSSEHQNDTCVDDPSGWVDDVGVGCGWYADDQSRCKDFDNNEHAGTTANDACCACGGGKAIPPLSWLGNESCSLSSPCLECQGNCDEDEDCLGTLQCFRRQGFELVPGCGGSGLFGKNYCFRTSSPTPSLKWLSWSGCSDSSPCGECEGDCDDDSDCVGSLKCFRRGGFTPVPGCNGSGINGGDYCHATTILAASPTLSPTSMKWFSWNGCSASNPCGECEGDCDEDSDCLGNLKCFQRSGVAPVPGCDGSGINDGDYCYALSTPNPTNAPTLNPVSNPTYPPTTDNQNSCMDDPIDWTDSFGDDCAWYSFQNRCQLYGDDFANFGATANEACCVCGGGKKASSLKWLGWNSCSASSPCGQCEGDCDSDSDCLQNLKCFRRNTLIPIPGCDGSGINNGDYCYLDGSESPTLTPTHSPQLTPIPNTVFNCTDFPFGWIDGVGNGCGAYAVGNKCQNDGYKFENKGFTALGACCVCGGGKAHLPLKWHSIDGCSPSDPCGECEGDCDVDSDCTGNLRCFRRLALEQVPGCHGLGEPGGDYCVEDYLTTDETREYPASFFNQTLPEINLGLFSDATSQLDSSRQSLTWKGWNECAIAHPCNKCVGQCNTDSDCFGNLECFQTNGTNVAIPGCGSGEKEAAIIGANYCFDPWNN